MSRYASYSQNDEQAQPEGDAGFHSLNQKRLPHMLGPGVVSESINKRLRRGIAETRPGVVTPAGFNAIAWGTIYGDGVYREMDSDAEWLLLATAAGVYRMADGHYPEPIDLPAGEVIDGPCEFVQALNRVILFRGTEKPELQWAGKLSDGFQFVDQSVDGTGTDPLPPAPTGELFADRLLVPVDRDGVAFSDLLDFTRFDKASNLFRIQSGTNERLTRIFPHSAATVVMFKERSTYALENVSGDLSQARLVIVSDRIGCCAPRSVVMVGADAFWLSASPAGVYRLQQVIQNRLQTAAIPVSDPIEPTIKRINWKAAAGACAVLWDEYYLLAVPLDSSETNNAILAFNTVGGPQGTGAWESVDLLPEGVSIGHFRVTQFQGRQRLFGIDYAGGRVLLFGEGKTDRVGNVIYPIQDKLTTRAYGFGLVDVKEFKRVHVALGTWNPVYTVTANPIGVGESAILAEEVTLDRAKSRMFSDPVDPSNAAGNHAKRNREDYSVVCPFTAGAGIRLGLVQERLDRFQIQDKVRALTITIEGKRGAVDVRAIALEETEARRETRAQR